MTPYVAWGTPIETIPSDLSNPQLIELLRACEEHPHFDLVELRLIERGSPYVGIVVDAGDGTVAPLNTAGIRPRERLCLSFQPDVEFPAEVRALRSDFPEVVHLNGVPDDEPASLCLYEDWGFSERQWTPQSHLRRILWWLEKTAEGTIHAQDQPPEQLFFGTGLLVILPADFQQRVARKEGVFYLEKVGRDDRRIHLVAKGEKPEQNAQPYQPLVVELPGIENRPVQKPPRTLGSLDDQLRGLGSELIPQIIEAVQVRAREGGQQAPSAEQKMILFACIPRLRDGVSQRLDVRGFIVDVDFEALGIALEVLGRGRPGEKAYPVMNLATGSTSVPVDGAWRDIGITPVEVRFLPTLDFARELSGVAAETADFVGVLAGLGALGGVLSDLWTREGWGKWDYIDPDSIAPHNIIRHGARVAQVGYTKVDFARAVSVGTFDRDDAKRQAIFAKANAFDNDAVKECLSGAQLLVDATTTFEVPRDWSERDVPRSASVFFTPSGMGAVMLLEDQARSIRLSALEAQYYRAILNEDWGQTHLQTTAGVRVGGGCRDRALVMSYELVQLHASQLARRLRKAVASDAAVISVWSLDDETGAIQSNSVAVSQPKERQCGQWSVRWDEGLEEKMRTIRQSHLPSETGGALVGVVDQVLRTITLVDACSAPSDSEADETGFTRGKIGVMEFLDGCTELTRGTVSYVGEWHSHPKGYPSTPSGLDISLLATLARRLTDDGLPAVMVIVSEADMSISLGEMRHFV